MIPTRLRVLALLAITASAGAQPQFTEVTTEAGLVYQHGFVPTDSLSELKEFSGGVAAGDYDRDGWIDLYVIRGDIGPNLLFRNRGDGTFEERGVDAGVALSTGLRGSGPTFADLDGDWWLDLLVGGVEGTPLTLFRNRGDGTFEDVTAGSGLTTDRDAFSTALGDIDRDGDLDLVIARWLATFYADDEQSSEQVWRNDGGFHFTDVTAAVGLVPATETESLDGFAPTLVDVTGDAWPDLLFAADFGTSHVFHNRADGTFVDATTPAISDENGMGSAVGDYDQDGDLDWFVSSIWDPNGTAEANWGVTGNRLYRNDGAGFFDDVTDIAGVRVGYWGWGSTFADFDADGDLDLFHVNGIGGDSFPKELRPFGAEYADDPSRLFVANGDGTFTEAAKAAGIDDTTEGRGVVAFDYDRDGDIDLFVATSDGPPRLYRNDTTPAGDGIVLRLGGTAPNREAVGALVSVTAGTGTQVRPLVLGSNYASHNPVEAHVGLGVASTVDTLSVQWPDGSSSMFHSVPTGHPLHVDQPDPEHPACGASAACAAGGTKGPAECHVALGLPMPVRGRKPKKATLRCRADDPACDTIPGDDACTVPVRVCIDVADVDGCASEPLASIDVVPPPPSKIDPDDVAITRALEAAITDLRLGPSTAAGPFAVLASDRCSAPAALTIPLRVRGNRRRASTRRMVHIVSSAVSDAVDDDRLRLVCQPPSR